MLQIKQLRKQHNLTMKQLGEIIGIAESTVSLYESGKRQADYDTLKKIANYFNVSIDYLLADVIDSDKIKTARTISKNLSSERNIIIPDFVEKFGINYQTFRAWYNGYGDYFNSAERLLKLADYFDVSLEYLLTGKEKSPSNDEELENVITWHRDGKTTTKQLTKEQMKFLEKMIGAMDDDVPDYL